MTRRPHRRPAQRSRGTIRRTPLRPAPPRTPPAPSGLTVIRELVDRDCLLTIGQLAVWLNLKVSYVYGLTALGRVPSYKIGAHRRFKPSEIVSWLAQRKDGAGTPTP